MDHAQRVVHTVVIPLMLAVAPVAGAGYLALALASKLAGGDVEHGEWDEVLRGLTHNVTTEINWRLAHRTPAPCCLRLPRCAGPPG